jgi:hypothetical protein
MTGDGLDAFNTTLARLPIAVAPEVAHPRQPCAVVILAGTVSGRTSSRCSAGALALTSSDEIFGNRRAGRRARR